jgi:hypothetical protein
MRIVRRTNQGGSATTFIIIGIILAIGLIGSIYFVKQRGEVVRKEQAIAAYDKQQAADKAATEATNKSGVVNTGEVDNATESSSPTQGLPATGPEFIVGELLGAGLMAVAIAGYLSSRRNLIRSL